MIFTTWRTGLRFDMEEGEDKEGNSSPHTNPLNELDEEASGAKVLYNNDGSSRASIDHTKLP